MTDRCGCADIKPGHIFRECPDFKCFRCQKTGHYAGEGEERNAAARRRREENRRRKTERAMTEGEQKRRLEVRMRKRKKNWTGGMDLTAERRTVTNR
ncbi:unnamed protein product [Merluccius merluccius]